MSGGSFADRQRVDSIRHAECQAMRALDGDDDYTRSEIAFMFECDVSTVKHHADCECQHIPQSPGWKQYTILDCLAAFREVYELQDQERMSQIVYDKHRPVSYPSSGTICRRFGSWVEAREAAWGDRGA